MKQFQFVRSLLAAGIVALAPMTAMADAADDFSDERLARIGEVMDREIEAGTFPGAVTLIAHDGEIVHLEAHGHLDPAGTTPMETDAVFRAFSMTKPVVSAAAMILVEEGRMALRDPVTQWMPELAEMTVLVRNDDDTDWEEVPAASPITVMDLLRHTSGLGYANNTPEPISAAYVEADVESRTSDVSPEELLTRLAGIPLVHQPGTTWHYGMSTDVLGVLVERVSGQRLDHFIAERILEPLGMEDTFWQVTGNNAARLAEAFETDSQREEAWIWARVEADPGLRYRLGGAALSTTAEDYYRFAQMILDQGELDGVRILAPKTVDLMLADHTIGLAGDTFGTTGPGYGFGLGFGVRRHDGVSWVPGSVGDAMWAGAGGTVFTIDPEEEIVGVFMAAALDPRQHTRFLFKTLLYGALVD